jgi:4-amino-4-deoxy-L-arabinose transferase-like glycosyltransferase
MQRDERLTSEIPQERAVLRPRAIPPWLLHTLPGGLAALLFVALVLGEPALGSAARPIQATLALALATAVLAQPFARAALRRVVMWPELPHAAAVAVVLVLGLMLRTWGLRFGLPYLEHPDEWAVADEAVRMLRSGDYSPFSYTYPTLTIYMQVGVAAAHFLWGAGAGLYRDLADLQPQHFYVWMRALTAALGTGALALTYALGRSLYDRAAGLAAAAILAVLPAAAGDAHYVTTDTPAMFFTLLALLAIARVGLAGERTTKDEAPRVGGEGRATQNRQRRELLAGVLLAGLATGLAAATKYNVGVLVLPLGLAVLLASRVLTEGRWRFVAAGGMLAALGVLLGFTLGVPLWLRELPRLVDDLASIIVHYRFEGHPGAEASRPALFYWWALTSEGLLFALAALVGALLAFVRRSRADLLVLAFVVPTVLQLSGVKVVFFRNAMPLLPLLCILAAALLVAAMPRKHEDTKARRPEEQKNAFVPARLRAFVLNPAALVALATLVIAAEPFAQALHDEQLRARPTTRILATAWVEQCAPDGARVWLEDGTLTLPARLRVQGGQPVTSHPPEWYRDNGFRLLVVNVDRAQNDPALLAAFGAPAATFERAGERHGPTLAIYDTGVGDPAGEQRTPSGATLGAGALALEGYRHPGAVRAGDVLPLALYWRAARPLVADYTVFVHLVDERGNKLAQRDTPPLDGSLPTSRWTPGQLIRDDQDLAVPEGVPPGSYRLLVGMYDAATLVAITDAGPVDVGEVVVR